MPVTGTNHAGRILWERPGSFIPRCVQDYATPAWREADAGGDKLRPYGPIGRSDVGEDFMPSRPMHSS